MKTIQISHDAYVLLGLAIYLFGLELRLYISRKRYERTKGRMKVYASLLEHQLAELPESLLAFVAIVWMCIGLYMAFLIS